MMKSVMVFGTFDGVHQGHRAMLKEARSFGEHLVVVIAQDHIVQHLKGRLPKVNLAERMNHIRAEDGVNEVLAGDKDLGTWEVVKRYRPNVIAIGYDQKPLREDLEAHLDNLGYVPEIVLLRAYEPEKYHSSKLNT